MCLLFGERWRRGINLRRPPTLQRQVGRIPKPGHGLETPFPHLNDPKIFAYVVCPGYLWSGISEHGSSIDGLRSVLTTTGRTNMGFLRWGGRFRFNKG